MSPGWKQGFLPMNYRSSDHLWACARHPSILGVNAQKELAGLQHAHLIHDTHQQHRLGHINARLLLERLHKTFTVISEQDIGRERGCTSGMDFHGRHTASSCIMPTIGSFMGMLTCISSFSS